MATMNFDGPSAAEIWALLDRIAKGRVALGEARAQGDADRERRILAKLAELQAQVPTGPVEVHDYPAQCVADVVGRHPWMAAAWSGLCEKCGADPVTPQGFVPPCGRR
jgi:hypothetical protein